VKTVKLNHTGEIARVSDERAERIAKLGTHTFVPKSAWKALRVAAPVVIPPTDEQKKEIQRKAEKRKHQSTKREYRKN